MCASGQRTCKESSGGGGKEGQRVGELWTGYSASQPAIRTRSASRGWLVVEHTSKKERRKQLYQKLHILREKERHNNSDDKFRPSVDGGG